LKALVSSPQPKDQICLGINLKKHGNPLGDLATDVPYGPSLRRERTWWRAIEKDTQSTHERSFNQLVVSAIADNPTTIVLTHNGPPPPQGADSLLSGFGVSSIRFNKQ